MADLQMLAHRLRCLTEDPAGRETLVAEYKEMCSQSLQGLTSKVGAMKENIKKNRYKDIRPYDQTRVFLNLLTSDSDSDYINANFIQGAVAGKLYIATQGPLSNTVLDFWRMVWEYHVEVIVMACREHEVVKSKCHCYWPPVRQTCVFGPFSVNNQGETSLNEDTVIRTLCVSFQQASRTLFQFQYISWPDHGTPPQPDHLLELLETVSHTHSLCCPLLVHCSAGCGRTGVICALDYIHDLLVTKQHQGFSIMTIVMELRRQRPSAVQTSEQYLFIFSAVKLMLENLLHSTPVNHLGDMTKLTSSTYSTTHRRAMEDMYAVVNKPKQRPTSPTVVVSPPPSSDARAPFARHHYDNDSPAAMATMLYSRVGPRSKPAFNEPASARLGEEPPSLDNEDDYEDVDNNDGYEYVSSPVREITDVCSSTSMGFNSRVKKPRGPRDPPAEWSRTER